MNTKYKSDDRLLYISTLKKHLYSYNNIALINTLEYDLMWMFVPLLSMEYI